MKCAVLHRCRTSSVQCMGFYLRSLAFASYARDRCVCPCLLMCLVGPNMCLWAAVNGLTPSADPLTGFLPLLVLPQDRAMMENVARALKAAKLGAKELTDGYQRLPTARLSDSESDQLMFPYKRTFKFCQREYKFDYDLEGQCRQKLVFAATLTGVQGGEEKKEDSGDSKGEGEEGLQIGSALVVKFTKTYFQEAHELCYAHNQSAPRLFACSPLPGGWLMVVMEAVEGIAFCPRQEGASVRLSALVNHMHENRLVHGDIREGNVLLRGDGSDGRVCVLDFDWAGRVGEARYPTFMNHADVNWPAGASDGELILPEHDMQMMHMLITQIE